MKIAYPFLQLLSTAIFLFTSLAGLAQNTGSIRGKITSSDGKTAEYVSVQLKERKQSTLTNAKGEYKLNGVKPGNYTIKVSAIGLTGEEKNVTVTAGAIVIADFVLNESASQLDAVTIQGRQNRYKIDKPSNSLRLNAPLQEIPQNIQVVSQGALADQQIISMSDGLVRNVSGAARVEHWGDLYTNITMRGSQIQAFRNGFNVVNSYWGPLTEDMSFVDHIEFVKGPAGFMLANGDPSGLYNVVTKKPTGVNKGEATLTLGSFDLYRATADLDGILSKNGKLLYRLNIAGQNKNSFRANEYNNRYSIAPVISYQIDPNTKVTAEYTLQHAKMSNVGSFYIFSPNGYASYNRNLTMLAPGLEPTKINDHSLFVNLEHNISDKWKLNAQASYFNYQQKGSSMWPDSVATNGLVRRSASIWDAFSEMTLGQVFLNGTAKTGEIQHRILAGLDVGTKNYYADWNQTAALDTIGGEFNALSPVNTVDNGFPLFDRSLSVEERAVRGGGLMDQRYTGLYAQDELGFLDNKLRLTLAGRYTYVSQSNYGGAPQTAKHFTPRVGLSVSVDDQTSVYGLYDQAFVPQNAILTSGEAAKPITGNNTEFGVKKDWFGGKWNTTLSAYKITKNHEVTTDAFNQGRSIEIGQKVAQGIEFDVRGEILKGLNLTANYAYTDAKVTKVNEGVGESIAVEGQRTPGSSKHTVNSWLNYKVLSGPIKGSGLSGGFTYLVDRATTTFSKTNPEQNLPDYFKLDAGAFWEKNNLRLTFNAFNILDRYLYNGGYYPANYYFTSEVYYWQAEAPRNYRLSVAYKF
ncbi:TonB-dependent siderophore receptor [Desertivirga arenae]|uniref:TonB-dependent siderophore receptor n=1 Tax=Desertivirga arenae TaxID=2810309 RepID=UPI001A96D90A|nr:TonB-dependent siderophore receptor [Pedobacter sp. SYSU D00823]